MSPRRLNILHDPPGSNVFAQSDVVTSIGRAGRATASTDWWKGFTHPGYSQAVYLHDFLPLDIIANAFFTSPIRCLVQVDPIPAPKQHRTFSFQSKASPTDPDPNGDHTCCCATDSGPHGKVTCEIAFGGKGFIYKWHDPADDNDPESDRLLQGCDAGAVLQRQLLVAGADDRHPNGYLRFSKITPQHREYMYTWNWMQETNDRSLSHIDLAIPGLTATEISPFQVFPKDCFESVEAVHKYAFSQATLQGGRDTDQTEAYEAQAAAVANRVTFLYEYFPLRFIRKYLERFGPTNCGPTIPRDVRKQNALRGLMMLSRGLQIAAYTTGWACFVVALCLGWRFRLDVAKFVWHGPQEVS
ncbi:hypothetical protein HDU86_005292 [Geranomyces michiganensis]|nr:hypothetical protein HDU86_005292 [Geranomyces michiganensis]